MPLSSITEQTTNISDTLFTSGDITTSSTIKLGDLVGALGVGLCAYGLIVLCFLIGVYSLGRFYFAQPGNMGMNDSANMLNSMRLLLKPLAWLFSGVIIFSFLVSAADLIYSVNMYNRLTFFLQIQYGTMVNNLSGTGFRLEVAKTVLVVADLLSGFIFYSIQVILIFLTFLLAGFIFSILLEKSQDDTFVKKIAAGLITAVLGAMLINIYVSNINDVFFYQTITIDSLGSMSSLRDAFTQTIKHWVHLVTKN